LVQYGGEVGVTGKLAGELRQVLGAGVVLQAERDPPAGFGPQPVAVGTDELCPGGGAPPLGPPHRQGAVRVGAGCASQPGEDAVDTNQMG
jgi:hypothetical protein